MAVPLVSKHSIFSWEPVGFTYSHALGVIAFDQDAFLALLQSTIHEYWSREQGSTLETRMRYTPTDCFETFPFPILNSSLSLLNSIGDRYYTHRQTIMQTRNEGLTKTYNRFHNPNETAEDITTLRQLHIEMDNAVATAYGWQDLSLDHNFHPTKQGIRFTISETARREVLDRLLQLNHDRYAEEVAQGLHDKKKKGKGKREEKKSAIVPEQGNLF